VVAGAAASLPVVARRTAAAGLTGFEWAVGVPGSVGGAVRMNAGGHGSDVAASLRSIRAVDLGAGQTREMTAADLGLDYRHSELPPTTVVTSATFALAAGDAAAAEAEVSAIVAWRREHQPGGANAGSVFTNPEGDSAGRLIDAAGGKGLSVGTASVSDKHANFIQASPGGSADDVVAVMRRVVALVEEHAGVRLHAETRLAGYPADVLEELGAVAADGSLP
jgi:UDP-N-acetylmuramate dehydrogenase